MWLKEWLSGDSRRYVDRKRTTCPYCGGGATGPVFETTQIGIQVPTEYECGLRVGLDQKGRLYESHPCKNPYRRELTDGWSSGPVNPPSPLAAEWLQARRDERERKRLVLSTIRHTERPDQPKPQEGRDMFAPKVISVLEFDARKHRLAVPVTCVGESDDGSGRVYECCYCGESLHPVMSGVALLLVAEKHRRTCVLAGECQTTKPGPRQPPPANVFPESTAGGPSAMPAVGLPPAPTTHVVEGYDLAGRDDAKATLYVVEHVAGHQSRHALRVEIAGPVATLEERRAMLLELVNAAQDLRERHKASLRYVEDLPRLMVRQGYHEKGEG